MFDTGMLVDSVTVNTVLLLVLPVVVCSVTDTVVLAVGVDCGGTSVEVVFCCCTVAVVDAVVLLSVTMLVDVISGEEVSSVVEDVMLWLVFLASVVTIFVTLDT